MSSTVRFVEPRVCEVVSEDMEPLGAGEVRLRTLYSGISAGTELTAYRGTNPYLNRRWDPEARLFVEGEIGMEYPVDGWGYEEVGEVIEVGPGVEAPEVGDVVWGTWGHRTHAVRSAELCAQRILPEGVDPRIGIFSQIGGIALNLVLDADIHLGETVVLFGCGVPGQMAAQMARLNGARVIVVDGIAARRDLALRLGADTALDPATDDVATVVRDMTGGRGADVVLEITGHYAATHEAIRCAAYNSKVIVASFLQGGGTALRLGEEFHHNRVAVISSQISGVNPALQHRWDFSRLCHTAIDLGIEGRIDLTSLISHEVPLEEAPGAFEMLDQRPSEALQVVLEFDGSAR